MYELKFEFRGAIDVSKARIEEKNDGVTFVISNGGNQTFRLLILVIE